MSKMKKISLAVCLALLPMSVYAAGLGKLSVNSNLGEPFKAEIELLAVTPEELESLVAVIASEDAYASQGITRLGIHSDIKVSIADAKSGRPKLVLSSNQAVNDPYLDMLIQLDWASGRLQREYTVLLDPPGYKQALKNEDVAPVVAPVAKSVEKPLTAPADDAQPESTKKTESADREVDQEIDQLTANAKPERKKVYVRPSQHRTKSGDNLSKIASRMRVQGVSLDQMLAGLYEQNKEAFVNGNMNRLKVGKIIKLPSKETLLSVSRSDASQTVQLHSTNWNAYRTGLASAAPVSKNIDQPSQSQSESGKIVAADKSTSVSQGAAQDVVKLSAGDKDKVEKDPKKAAEAKKVAEQEDKVAHDKALEEAQDRTVAVEKQIEDMQKLLALKNKAMTDLQKKAEADKAAQTPAPSSDANEVKPVEPKVDAVAPTEPLPTEAKPEEVKPAEVAPVPPPVAAQPKPPVVEPVAVEEPSFFDSLKESVNFSILGGIGGIILLGAGWMYLRNKRRKDLESFERGILTSGGLRANTVFGNTTGSTSATDTSFLTDFAQSTDGTMIDTNDVDPIAEAEVYMAYGRDAQAEEILKDAISKEPKRYELHLKLLEMYANRKDSSAFEAIAGELYTTLGADDPTWTKVVELGRVLEPENPLYAQTPVSVQSAASTQSEAEKTQDYDIPVATEKVVNQPSNVDLAMSAFSASAANEVSSSLSAPDIQNISKVESIVERESDDIVQNLQSADDDFTLKLNATEPNDAAPVVEQDDLRIQRGFESDAVENISYDADLGLSTENQYEVTQSELSASDLDFDLNREDKELQADTNLKAFDLSNISLDLNESATELTLESPELESKGLETGDATSTSSDANDVEVKLNLVAAYIDMDDKEGARELLEEVLKEGSDEQVVRAQMMLDSIS
jgi:pilus assembly protein FimV